MCYIKSGNAKNAGKRKGRKVIVVLLCVPCGACRSLRYRFVSRRGTSANKWRLTYITGVFVK